jgi:hypothetical protein
MGRRSDLVALDFPEDKNGNALRRKFEEGDDLSVPRPIDFYFAFDERQQALGFAAVVEERDLHVCISSDEQQEGWMVIVTRHMVPAHAPITELESSLTERARSAGGEADGWGCLPVDP